MGFDSLNWVCACRGGVQQPWCVHAEVGFDSLELHAEVGFYVHAEVGFDSLELGVCMQRWDSTSLNWVCVLVFKTGKRRLKNSSCMKPHMLTKKLYLNGCHVDIKP